MVGEVNEVVEVRIINECYQRVLDEGFKDRVGSQGATNGLLGQSCRLSVERGY